MEWISRDQAKKFVRFYVPPISFVDDYDDFLSQSFRLCDRESG